MKITIDKVPNIYVKNEIIQIISKYELRISQGTRYIVHLEAMMLEILTFIQKSKNNLFKNKKIEYII